MSAPPASATAKQVGLTLLVVLPLFIPHRRQRVHARAGCRLSDRREAAGGDRLDLQPPACAGNDPAGRTLELRDRPGLHHPIATALVMFAIAVLVGLSALKGLYTVTILLAPQPAITLVSGYPRCRSGRPRRGSSARR